MKFTRVKNFDTKLRGLRLNQRRTTRFIYLIDQHTNKINTLGVFENEIPTHMSAI